MSIFFSQMMACHQVCDSRLIDGVVKGLILAIPLFVMVANSYFTGSKIGKNFERMKMFMLLGLSLMTISYALLIFFENVVVWCLLFLSKSWARYNVDNDWTFRMRYEKTLLC